jgi:GDP-L-fucose synthase
MGFWDNKQVIVTGGAGFLGSSIVQLLRARNASQVFVPRSAEYDLRRLDDIARLFDTAASFASPEQTLVIHAAARVGGIGANVHQPATYFYDNLLMNIQLLDAAAGRNISKFVAIGSIVGVCEVSSNSFSRVGPLEWLSGGNERAIRSHQKDAAGPGAGVSKPVRLQLDLLLPTNLYGPGDNFDLEQSHVDSGTGAQVCRGPQPP